MDLQIQILCWVSGYIIARTYIQLILKEYLLPYVLISAAVSTAKDKQPITNNSTPSSQALKDPKRPLGGPARSNH